MFETVSIVFIQFTLFVNKQEKYILKTLFNIVEALFKNLLNFYVCVV